MDSWATDHRILKLWVVVLLIAHFTACQVKAVIDEASASSSTREYKPVGPTEYRVLQEAQGNAVAVADDARRRLAPFQLCLLCKCCTGSGSAASTCTTMPCCFGIDCQLPNKPFGVCAFVPKTCNFLAGLETLGLRIWAFLSASSLDQIRAIERPIDVPDQGLLFDLLWADPNRDISGWSLV
ncbi:hypothetical protein REPUB_Repub20aG0000800 [Reevesia pubescens]